ARPGLARIDRGAAAPEDLGALREIPLFAPLNPATLEQLATSLAHVTVPAGATVFAQGDPGDRYYLIAEGEAEAQVDGRPTRVMHAGEAFGEIALLRDTPRTATVHAHT